MNEQGSYYLILGLGITGQSVARFLDAKNIPFIVFDTRENPKGLENFRKNFPNVSVILKDAEQVPLNLVEKIISSPGISHNETILQKAKKQDIPICGDIEILVHEINAPIIAITGTNGKSTVTTLVGEMAKTAGINVAVAGNIGTPVLDLLSDDKKYDLWVLELSSFQLELTNSLEALCATILNISPDHIDHHLDFDGYVSAKHRIYINAKNVIYNRDDKLTFPKTNANKSSFGFDTPQEGQWGIVLQDKKYFVAYGTQVLLGVGDIEIKGTHNWLNAMAAMALAQTINISMSSMIKTLKSFKGLAHRGQLVKTVNNVDWINDSKGTNVGATSAALYGLGGSMQGRIILIAGGQGKGANFSELQAPINEFVKLLIVFGEDADKIASSVHDVEIMHVNSLDDAVVIANMRALPGDSVLLSPACASFDMFTDFNHRGERFIEAVENL